VTDGTSNDVGRWKVKLDAEWRGRDADGTKILRSDSLSLDTDGNEKHQEQEEDSSNMNVVVAKAENLELVDGDNEEEEIGNFGAAQQIDVSHSQRRLARSRSRSLSKQQKQTYASGEEGSPYRRSRDPSVSDRQRGMNDPVSVTPENNIPSRSRGASRSGERRTQPYKDISPVNYYKSSSGRYHEEEQQQRARSSSSKKKQVTRQVSPKRTQQQEPVTWQEAQERKQQRQSRSSSVKKNSTKKQPAPHSSTPIRRTASTDSERLSTAFSRMLMSPVSFTPASFEPEPSESFQQWVVKDKNATKYVNESQQAASSAGEAFFDEVTSPYTDYEREDDYKHHGYEEWEQSGEGYDNPQLSMYDTPVSHEETPVTTTQDGHSLPNIVILPVDDDDINNPFLSPGYESNTPPHCVGVQNAGVPYINGVYLLAYPKDENGNAIVVTASNGGNNIPPLYFKDGPPTLLGDNRYYDMCILRIDCPDSSDHVIWFLARVDVDPQQLDVKFSDCYYYCRMLRNDDGCGGEVTDDDGVCHVPPFTGWNIPSIPHGVGELSISGQQQSSSFSTSTGGGGGRGIGIVPRGKTSGETVPHFVSPGKYSV